MQSREVGRFGSCLLVLGYSAGGMRHDIVNSKEEIELIFPIFGREIHTVAQDMGVISNCVVRAFTRDILSKVASTSGVSHLH
jgi:hypothetical protein